MLLRPAKSSTEHPYDFEVGWLIPAYGPAFSLHTKDTTVLGGKGLTPLITQVNFPMNQFEMDRKPVRSLVCAFQFGGHLLYELPGCFHVAPLGIRLTNA